MIIINKNGIIFQTIKREYVKKKARKNMNNINLFHFVFVDKSFRFSNHMLKLILFSLCKYINSKIKF